MAIGIVTSAHVSTVVETREVFDNPGVSYVPLGEERWGVEKTLLQAWLGLRTRGEARVAAYTAALLLVGVAACMVRVCKQAKDRPKEPSVAAK
jgi:hypothetical protein